MNVADLLLEQAARRGDAAAIIESRRGRDRAVSYRELVDRSARAATMLHDAGLRPGDRVLVLAGMSAELYVVLLTLFRLGLVATFLDPSAGRAHVARCCEIARPAAMIGAPRAHLLRLLCPQLRRIPRQFTIGRWLPGVVKWGRIAHHGPRRQVEPVSPDAPALLTFTSGSTGEPKAAVRSHGFLGAQHTALAEALELEGGQIDLATLPIFALANLASGLTTVIPDCDLRSPGRIEPGPVLRQIARLEPRRCVASPAFLERLLDAREVAEGSLASFERIFTGGAPVFPDLLERLQAAAPAARVEAVYGSTEAEPIAEVAWDSVAEGDRQAMRRGQGLLAGRPVEQVDLAILPSRWGEPIPPLTPETFERMHLQPGEAGEIVVAGEHVLPGYLGGRGDEETKFRVGATVWHRTGDSGYLDSQGRLWLLGRAGAIIRDERGELHPLSVECAARELPGVRLAALLAHQGQRVLVVEPAEASGTRCDPEAIRDGLAWAQLDRVLEVKRIPLDRRHNAKVDYPRLRALVNKRMSSESERR
ncbi:MAG: AMP-binding protein [Phycisphaeraceae bacterium]